MPLFLPMVPHKILRVLPATVISESEFQSHTILWLNTFLRISSLLWHISNLSLRPLVHHPSALRKNNSGSNRSSQFMILYTWIMSPLPAMTTDYCWWRLDGYVQSRITIYIYIYIYIKHSMFPYMLCHLDTAWSWLFQNVTCTSLSIMYMKQHKGKLHTVST